MGFRKIEELRTILSMIPPEVLNPTQRLVIATINSYSNDDDPDGACWIGHERLSQEVGVGTRGLMKNLHFLGDGSTISVRGQKRPCTQHPEEVHLNVIRRHVQKVRVGQRQSYSIKWHKLRSLASVNSGSPSHSESMNSDDLECELQTIDVGTQVHTYRDNKHNKNLSNDFYLEQILEQIPRDKRGEVSNLPRLDELFSKYKSKGGLPQVLVDVVSQTEWSRINSPNRYLEAKLCDEVEKFSPTPIPPRFSAEDYR